MTAISFNRFIVFLHLRVWIGLWQRHIRWQPVGTRYSSCRERSNVRWSLRAGHRYSYATQRYSVQLTHRFWFRSRRHWCDSTESRGAKLAGAPAATILHACQGADVSSAFHGLDRLHKYRLRLVQRLLCSSLFSNRPMSFLCLEYFSIFSNVEYMCMWRRGSLRVRTLLSVVSCVISEWHYVSWAFRDTFNCFV